MIAYEFLSLLVGNLIYDNRLVFIREFIKGETKSEKPFIEYLTSQNYSPYHKIYPEFLKTEVIINTILFRWLVHKVHLKVNIKDFNILSSDFVYLEDLKNRKTLISESVEEARRGVHYGF